MPGTAENSNGWKEDRKLVLHEMRGLRADVQALTSEMKSDREADRVEHKEDIEKIYKRMNTDKDATNAVIVGLEKNVATTQTSMKFFTIIFTIIINGIGVAVAVIQALRPK